MKEGVVVEYLKKQWDDYIKPHMLLHALVGGGIALIFAAALSLPNVIELILGLFAIVAGIAAELLIVKK